MAYLFDEFPIFHIQVCSVLDSLERDYRREEDSCGFANSAVHHVIGKYYAQITRPIAIVTSLHVPFIFRRKFNENGRHAATDPSSSGTKRELLKGCCVASVPNCSLSSLVNFFFTGLYFG